MPRWIPSPNFLPGSTDVGSQDSDTHKFTGSVSITGSLTLNGSAVTTGGGGGISWSGSTANGVATYKDADEATVQSALTFDGTTLTVTGNVSASSNISASSFYGSADNLIASYTAHDTMNPILTSLETTGKINAEQYFNYEYLSGHSYLYLSSNGDSRSPKFIMSHGLPGARPDSITTFWSSDSATDDPFYITRRTSNNVREPANGIYYPITIWNSYALNDPTNDKVGINMPYPVTASYRFDVSGSSRFQEDVTIDGSTILGAGTGSTPGIARPWTHQVSGTLHVSGGIMQQQYFSASISSPVNATCSLYNVFNYHLTADSEVTASSPVAGTSYLFFFRQDGTGAHTVDFSGFKWPGGTAPTLSIAGGAVDIVSGISDGEYIYADTTKNFS